MTPNPSRPAAPERGRDGRDFRRLGRRMTSWTLAALILPVLAGPSLAQPPERFDAAKRLLAGIHQEIGHLRTLYCRCPYVRRGRSGGDIDRDACGLEARMNENRSERVEWEHVVPASWFGSHRTCWRTGHPLCGTKKNGKPVKGRACCLKPGVDAEFRSAHNDPHNLFPAGGEVNGDRSAHPYGTVAGEPRAYGRCDFEVGGRPKVAEPAIGVRGEVARAMLYMADRYAVDVRMTRDELRGWHRADPPDAWELERARRIEAETGLRNRYLARP